MGRNPPQKPFSPACERNRAPILQVLQRHLPLARRVLEIGSGTGQHAVYFAAAMPWLCWQCSDRAEHLAGIAQWLDEAALANTPRPWPLDVSGRWPEASFDAIYTANTLHIMGWDAVQALFAGIGNTLQTGGHVIVYGPFNDGGRYSSESNRQFDQSLKARDPRSGIRDFEAVDALARSVGLVLQEDVAMPANNRCLVWRGDSGRPAAMR
jgi:SAM-dependent methyltransferase